MILDSLDVDPIDLEQRTGWTLKPEGLCKGPWCVPLSKGTAASGPAPTALDARVLSERLGMPLVEDAEHGLWALGPETLGGRTLASAQAPEVVLPDLDGNPFRLSSLKGQKVLLVAWASW